MNRLKKYLIAVLCIVTICTLTGCEDAYKKGNVKLFMDEKGAGYFEQEFAISKKYFDLEVCKLGSADEFIKLLDNEINRKNTKLGVEATFDISDSENINIKLKMKYSSLNDFNTKVNAIIDRINTLTTNAKVYDSTYGIWVRNSGIIVSKLINEKLDKLNIAYDMDSIQYRYLISRLVDYEDEIEIDNIGTIGDTLLTNDLRYVKYYHFDNATYKHINAFEKKGNNLILSEFATQILDNYLVDIVVSNFDTIVDVDMLNKQIKDFLIEDYTAYINRQFIREEDRFKAEMEKNNIVDISSMTLEEIDRIFGSYTVAETINSYHDISPDMYVYLPTKQLFGIDPVVNKEKTYLNGKQISFKKGEYKCSFNGNLDINTNNETDDTIDKNSLDDTPPTGDSNSILLLQVIMSLSFVGLIILLIYRRKLHV